jgi:hypothetical protein
MQPETADTGEITFEEARRLFELSLQAHWSFPTSFGRRVRWKGPDEWIEEMDK